jgi:hypothetical protein
MQIEVTLETELDGKSIKLGDEHLVRTPRGYMTKDESSLNGGT